MILLSSFVFGLVFGSFLNVVIYRLKNGRNAIFGRSFCPGCNTQLRWHDLVPLLSFIYLRGRCRYCREKISWQYPIVEIFSGFIWVSVFYQNFNNIFQLLDVFYQIFILSIVLVVAIYDFKWQIIPDKIVYPAIAVALIYNGFNLVRIGDFKIFIIQFLTASFAFLFFFLIYFFSKGYAMGLGDAKLAFLIGLFLSPILAGIAFVLAFVLGAIFGIILLMVSKIPHPLFYKGWGIKSQIAFGPFLILGAFIVFFFSDFIFKFFQP